MNDVVPDKCPVQVSDAGSSPCGDHRGSGTCNEDTAECMCSWGWTGSDCSSPTCCPVAVIILVVLFVVIVASALCLWYCCWKPFRQDNPLNVDTPVPIKKNRVIPDSKEEESGTEETVLPFDGSGLDGQSNLKDTADMQDAPASAPTVDQWATAAAVAKEEKRRLRDVWKPKLTPGGSRIGPAPGETPVAPASKALRSKSAPGAAKRRQPSPTPPTKKCAEVPAEALVPLTPEALAVHRRLTECRNKPIAERKQIFRELVLEYHPDKNSLRHAKEVFQYVNDSKSWFLAEDK